jgi:hypothetical protein
MGAETELGAAKVLASDRRIANPAFGSQILGFEESDRE